MSKQPQDHQKKKAKRLQQEAQGVDPMESLLGEKIPVAGRLGTIEVTVLEDPMDWESTTSTILTGWAERGGARVDEAIPFLKGIISMEDGGRIDAVKPTNRTSYAILDLLFSNPKAADDEDEGDDEGESMAETVGESRAS